MPLGCIRVDRADYPPVPMTCMRCATEAAMQFAGLCENCRTELRATFRGEARAVDAVYEPKMNVTPNAVALKDD